ncbi:MAG: membrane protein insertion efficiency factor YidD, partial [Pseudomonadales bacterium]
VLYKLAISPLLGHHCRFYPSCSSYMAEAIQELGIRRGLILGLKRLAKCHPWHAGGVDTIPARHSHGEH